MCTICVIELINHAKFCWSWLNFFFIIFAVSFAGAPAELSAVSVALAFARVLALARAQWVQRLIDHALIVLLFFLFLLTLFVIGAVGFS